MGHLQVTAGLVALLFAGTASAISGNSIVTPHGPAVVYTTANSATVIYGGNAINSASLARAYGLQTGGVAVTDQVALRSGANAIVGTAARTVALGEIAAGAARLLANPLIGGALIVGPIVWDMYTRSRLRPTPGQAGGIEVNSDGTVRGDSYWVELGLPDTRLQSPDGICPRWLRAMQGAPDGPHTCTLSFADANNVAYQIRAANGGLVNTVGAYRIVESWCFNADGVAVVRPTGGLCPGGVWGPISVDDAAARMLPKLGANAADVLREVTNAGGDVVAGPTSLTGPAQGTPQTITSNGPNGSSTTTVNNNYTYNDNSVTWSQTTNTSAPGGNTTTTNPTPADERSNCERDPDTVGCMKPGTPPTDSPQWATKTVNYEVDALGLPAACPAPRVMMVHGWELKLDYAVACQVAPTISQAITALTALGCLLLIVRTVKA